MNTIIENTEWMHGRSDTRYKVLDHKAMVKINGNWEAAVSYISMNGNPQIFIRTHDDFLNSFSFVRFL